MAPAHRRGAREGGFAVTRPKPWADTTSPAGRMALTVFGGIAEFERALIAERTEDGRRPARQRGVAFGRPPKLRPE